MRFGVRLWALVCIAAVMPACASHTGSSAQTPTVPVVKMVNIKPVSDNSYTLDDSTQLWTAVKQAFDENDFAAAYQDLTILEGQQEHWLPLGISDDGDLLHVMMGDAALGLGYHDKAKAHYEAAAPSIARYAGTTLARIGLGEAGDVEVALNAALEINMTDIRLWQALGRYHDDAGRWIEAQEIYVRALRSGADHGAVLNNMGMSLLMQGRYSEAQAKFDQATTLDGTVTIYRHNLHITYALQQDYKRMAESLPDSDAAIIYNDAGLLAMRGKRNILAASLLEKALSLSPVHFAIAEANLRALKSGS